MRGNGAHAARGNGDIAFRQHFEYKFKHAAGGFQFTIEENSAEKRTEKTVDEFVGEAGGDQSIFCGAFGALENLFDGRIAEARTEPEDAQLVEEAAEIGAKSFTPRAGSAPGIHKPVQATRKPGKRAGSELF